MSEPSLSFIEAELDETRRRLALDLSRLTSPSTLSALKQDVIEEVWQSRDELVEKTRDAARAASFEALNNLKGRIIANPVAALAIGGGIAWRLFRNPPVSSVLVGIGVMSLMKTEPGRDAVADLHARAGAMADTAVNQISQLSLQAREASAEAIDSVSSAAAPIKDRIAELSQSARDEIADLFQRMGRVSQRGASKIAENRDNYLLGGAALAIAAALGVSYARRIGS